MRWRPVVYKQAMCVLCVVSVAPAKTGLLDTRVNHALRPAIGVRRTEPNRVSSEPSRLSFNASRRTRHDWLILTSGTK